MFQFKKIQYEFLEFLTKHLYIVLFVPLLFIAYPLLVSPGIPIGNGDLPYIETSLYSFKKLWTWNDYGSYHGMETLPRYPIIVLLQLINVSPEITSKLLIIGGFAIASFSFYFSCFRLFRPKVDIHDIKFKAALILGSLFYAYNVWSFHRIGHWYFWIGYAILPLFFVSIIYAFKDPKKWKYILASVLLWSIASSTLHMTIFYAIIFAGLSILFLVKYIRKNQKLSTQILRPIFLIIALYTLVNLYWIYPYVVSYNSESFQPQTVVTEENIVDLSSDSYLLNVLRLIEGTFNMGTINAEPSNTSATYPIWIFASFVVPVLAFSALVWKNKLFQYTLFFSVISLIGLFLTIGSNAPFNFYSALLFYAPLISYFQLLFREPDKWAYLVAFGYSFLLVIANFKILNKVEKMKYNKLFSISLILFLLTCITIYFFPAYKDSLENLYQPVVLPTEFSNLENYFRSINADKVLIMPYSPPNLVYSTTWGGDKGTASIYSAASPAPNISPSDWNNIGKYHRYILNSIIANKTNNLENIIDPLGASYLLYHNDTLMPTNNDILNKLSSLDGVKHLKNIGLFNIFKIGDEKKVGQVNIPLYNSLIVGGLDKFASMNFAFPFNSINSLLFLERQTRGDNDYYTTHNANYGFLTPNEIDFILSFVDDKYLVAPFDATNHHEPTKFWSKAGINDPGNAYFTPDLEVLGIENWDFDYGKGLVMTNAPGANISMPLDIEDHNGNDASKDDIYYLYMRYFKNQRGGSLNIYVDGKLTNQVDSSDKISNNFEWEKIGSINLKKGKHTLTLTNLDGFNAVNIFSLVPQKEMDRLRIETAHILEHGTRVIYLLESESNFYNNKGIDSGSFHYLLDEDSYNGTFSRTFRGQFRVPENTDLVTLQFFTKQNPDAESTYSIKDLEINPAYRRYNVFASDPESTRDLVPRASLRQFDWTNNDKDMLSISETKGVTGNNSLKVDIKQGNFSHWGVISSDFIPINQDRYYNVSLDVLANDVRQLHSKVYYYDSDKNELKLKPEFFSDGKDGSFEQKYNKFLSAPLGTRYIKLQTWVSPNPNNHSNYLLGNVKLEEIIPYGFAFKDNFASFQDINPEIQDIMILNNSNNYDRGNSSLKQELGKGNSTQFYKIQTTPFPVEEDRLYNYTLSLEAQDVNSLSGIASFKSSSDVIEHNKYGNNASNGRLLSLRPGSEIHTALDIIKPSNYTIALRAKTCETCTFLRVSMIEQDYDFKDNSNKNDSNIIKTSNIFLKDKASGLKWLYSNSTYPLNKGNYELKIYSDSQAELDSVAVYQSGNVSANGNDNLSGNTDNQKHAKTLDDLFDPEILPAAQISKYKKINPTKHIIDIVNATRPFMISFAETYDPLWIAYTNSSNDNYNTEKNNYFKTSSVPLYSVVNGFYVNKTGNYSLTIEYQPQKWFIEAGTVSLLTLIGALTFYFTGTHKRNLMKLKSRLWDLLRAKDKHLD